MIADGNQTSLGTYPVKDNQIVPIMSGLFQIFNRHTRSFPIQREDYAEANQLGVGAYYAWPL